MPAPTDIAPTRYCLSCRYVLDGLPDERCPECGREFDPQIPSTYATTPRRSVAPYVLAIVPVILLLGQWASLYRLLPPGPLECLLFAAAILFAVVATGHRIIALLSLGMSPAVIYFVSGCVSYFSGTAELGPIFLRNGVELVDRQARLPRLRHPMGAPHIAWSRGTVHDGAVLTMRAIFGPMRGSYLGEYPTPDECDAALAKAVEVRCVDLTNDQIRQLPVGPVLIGEGVGRRLLLAGGHWLCADPNSLSDEMACESELPLPRAARIGKFCIAVRMTHRPEGGGEEGGEVTFLIDAERGHMFACYWKGDFGWWSVLPWHFPAK